MLHLIEGRYIINSQSKHFGFNYDFVKWSQLSENSLVFFPLIDVLI